MIGLQLYYNVDIFSRPSLNNENFVSKVHQYHNSGSIATLVGFCNLKKEFHRVLLRNTLIVYSFFKSSLGNGKNASAIII